MELQERPNTCVQKGHQTKHLLAIVVVCSLVAWISIVPIFRSLWQRKLNQDLRTAVSRLDDAAVEADLHAGADPNARGGIDVDRISKSLAERVREIIHPTPPPRGWQTALEILLNIRNSPLIQTKHKNRRIAEALFEHGARVDDIDTDGDAVFCKACGWEDVQTVDAFLEHGANVNMHSVEGNTPIMNATAYMRPDIIELLLAHGADVRIRNTAGQTAVDFATDVFPPNLSSAGHDIDNKVKTVFRLLRAAALRAK